MFGDSRLGTVRETRSIVPLARGAYCQSAAFFVSFFAAAQRKKGRRLALRNLVCHKTPLVEASRFVPADVSGSLTHPSHISCRYIYSYLSPIPVLSAFLKILAILIATTQHNKPSKGEYHI
jgi:hypothetical protein